MAEKNTFLLTEIATHSLSLSLLGTGRKCEKEPSDMSRLSACVESQQHYKIYLFSYVCQGYFCKHSYIAF
jgi:hypothetical protein